MHSTLIKEVMREDPTFIDPSCSLKEAAEKMEQLGCGVLPVGTAQAPQGIITDRDIVIRAIAKGKDVTTETVGDYMTKEVFSCSPEDTLEDAADVMHKHQINRLLVKDEKGNARGILTLGTIMRKTRDRGEMNNAIERAVRPAA